VLLAVGIAVVASSAVFAQIGGGYNLSWNTIDGGGGQSTGGAYNLHGSIGQADASTALTGGSYALTGGFWISQPTTVPTVAPTPTTAPTAQPKIYLPQVRR
jgi:hypothetical protein